MPTEYQRYRVLWPLVPAMAMVMIDFTIVSISASTIQSDLDLSETAVQWLVTAYALSTAAFVALGGRLGDILGHRRIVITGVIVFAGSSLMCGLVPDSAGVAVAWLIFFRVLQGVGGGLLIPSATVLVLDAFPGTERGKGLAIFFIVAGLFTAIGPIAGSYLTEFWTWRAIFWINVPVALLALIEFRFAKLNDVKHPSRLDVRGAVLIVVGMGLTVLGIQQSTEWGWDSPATWLSIVAGLVVLAALRRRRAQNRGPADRRQRAGRQPPVRGRQPAHLPRLRPLARRLLLRQHVLPGRGRPGTDPGRLLDPDDVLFLLRRRPDRRRLDGQVRGQETGLRSASCSARSG